MALVLWVGWKASQNTYLLASEHVNGLNLSHMKLISNNPVPQHAFATSSNPALLIPKTISYAKIKIDRTYYTDKS